MNTYATSWTLIRLKHRLRGDVLLAVAVLDSTNCLITPEIIHCTLYQDKIVLETPYNIKYTVNNYLESYQLTTQAQEELEYYVLRATKVSTDKNHKHYDPNFSWYQLDLSEALHECKYLITQNSESDSVARFNLAMESLTKP